MKNSCLKKKKKDIGSEEKCIVNYNMNISVKKNILKKIEFEQVNKMFNGFKLHQYYRFHPPKMVLNNRLNAIYIDIKCIYLYENSKPNKNLEN